MPLYKSFVTLNLFQGPSIRQDFRFIRRDGCCTKLCSARLRPQHDGVGWVFVPLCELAQLFGSHKDTKTMVLHRSGGERPMPTGPTFRLFRNPRSSQHGKRHKVAGA
jgi:hypothetical protein